MVNLEIDAGEKRLRELGYKQELKRDLSFFTNFAFSFNIISILTGVTTLYATGLNYGGPATLIYGWVVVGFFTSCVAASMAEICSAYPTSGGLYFWSAILGGPEWGPFAAWMTGWFNAVGQWAVTAAVDFSLAQWIGTTILLSTGTALNGGYSPPRIVIIAIYAFLLIVHGLLNTCRVTLLAKLETISVWWHVGGTFLLIFLLPFVAPTTQSASYVFATFTPDPSTGITSTPYLFLLGLLFAQYSLSGFDASAHMTEETKSADNSGAWGIVSSVVISAVVGFFYIIALTFAIQDPAYIADPTNESGGYASAQIMWDAFYHRYGSGTGGIICMQVVTVAIFFCGMSSLASCSRMNYAFARDGAMPGSFLWKQSHPKTGVPVNAVWLSVVVAFLMGLPFLGSTVAFTALTSVSTIGLYIAYGLPILMKLTLGRKRFQAGPFNLGPFSDVCGVISILWICTIVVLFVLPTVYPITPETFQFSSVATSAVLFGAVGSWIISARHWFKGPVRNIDVTMHHNHNILDLSTHQRDPKVVDGEEP